MASTQTTILTIESCRIDTQSIDVVLSEAIDTFSAVTCTIFAPESGYTGTGSATLPQGWKPTTSQDGRSIVMGGPNPALTPGDWVLITLDITPPAGKLITLKAHGRVISEAGRSARDVEDAISYPVLTEEVAYRPSSPVGIPTTGAGGIAGPGGSNIGQVAMQAVTDVLGWKVNTADPKGFLGALTQSFNLKDVEGHTESSWVPRTYAVQTDLGGGITGAQASLYLRAKDALDQSLSLLDGLYPLDPEADPEYVRALREMARSQMTEIVKELGVVGLPSILRINTYFKILLGQDITESSASGVTLDPDQIDGTLGEIRKEYGIYFAGNPFNNSVEDEQDITNFRVISDYMTSLSQSWIANRKFFKVESKQPAFFGTQLVLISRQFNVIAETVNEVRFALDSVFIGPNERRTLLLKFPDPSKFPAMYLEDVLDEVDGFVTDEGPRLLRDGGKISVKNNIRPVVKELKEMIKETRDQKDKDVPKGFKTARVRRTMDDLHGQLDQLLKLTKQVEQNLPKVEDVLEVDSVSPAVIQKTPSLGAQLLSVYGDAFEPGSSVSFDPDLSSALVAWPDGRLLDFYSSQRVDVNLNLQDPSVQLGTYDVTVTNPDGSSATLAGGLTIVGPGGAGPGKGGKKIAIPLGNSGPTPPGSGGGAGLRKRQVVLESEGVEVPAEPSGATAQPSTPGAASSDEYKKVIENYLKNASVPEDVKKALQALTGGSLSTQAEGGAQPDTPQPGDSGEKTE